MWEPIWTAFFHLLEWPAPLVVLLGTVAGFLFGAIPGLNGPIFIALLIPLTVPLGATGAMILVGAGMGALSFGGAIPAVLLNTPGDEPNAATTIDGFPLAQKGMAAVALGVSALASALGGIIGLFLLVLVLPFGYQLILAFSYPENFILSVLGISLVVVLTRGDILKGLIAAGVGLMLSFVGQDPLTGELRFVFGSDYLWDGIDFVAALIGLFAVSEALEMMVRGGTIASSQQARLGFGFVRESLASVKILFRNFWLFLRSTVLGFLVGVIPGVGGTVASFVAYMHCVQSSKDKSNFGKGDIRGVLAVEAANDSKDGGALLPTLLLGLPGSAMMAVLLGLFLLHGITPGPQVLSEDMDKVATLIDAHVVGNIVTVILGMLAAPFIAKLTFVRVTLIGPVLMAVSLLGSYSVSGESNDILVALIFGFAGYAFARFGFSKVAVVLGLVMGPLMERSFHLTVETMGLSAIFTRPLSLVLLLLTCFLFFWSLLQRKERGSVAF
ncbi:MAG: tripartite tricarboxylate transporter permease [Acidobacteria bacterium]|nr:tripartite tricarboxylate transporter permease [Acidobacteriota bacterium]